MKTADNCSSRRGLHFNKPVLLHDDFSILNRATHTLPKMADTNQQSPPQLGPVVSLLSHPPSLSHFVRSFLLILHTKTSSLGVLLGLLKHLCNVLCGAERFSKLVWPFWSDLHGTLSVQRLF